MRRDEHYEAELFAADLLGRHAAAPFEASLSVPGLDGDSTMSDRAEPFFGDATHDAWRVALRPGEPLDRIEADDLVAWRDGGRSWRCALAQDVGLAVLRARRHPRVLRDGVIVLRRRPAVADGEAYGEVVEICGFFGPNGVRRTEPQIRDAVVAWAQAEWTAWHTVAGVPRLASDAALFGRLLGYALAAEGRFLPDTLTGTQAAAMGAINYGPLLTGGPAVVASEVTRIRSLLLAGAPGAGDADVPGRVDTAILQARQAHLDAGDFRSWSATFVSAVVRGVAIAQGLEAVIAPARTHIGRDELLLASIRHSGYTVEGRQRAAARLPRRRGTYHALPPTAQAPRAGDLIVQDRRDTLTGANQVMTLPACPPRLRTHGDVVVDVQPGFVVTIGGNLGLSVRKRRYPLDARGLLVVDRRQLFAQEDDAGALAALPLPTALPIADRSTARIFALLSPIEECAAVPGQPWHGGILT